MLLIDYNRKMEPKFIHLLNGLNNILLLALLKIFWKMWCRIPVMELTLGTTELLFMIEVVVI